jgi:hypothetical protein
VWTQHGPTKATAGKPHLHRNVTPGKNHLIGLNLTSLMPVLDFFTKLLLSIAQHLLRLSIVKTNQL